MGKIIKKYRDITGDGLINYSDLSTLKQHMLKMTTLKSLYLQACNMDYNLKITISAL